MRDQEIDRQKNFFGNIGLLCWIICVRFLFPLPIVFSGTISANSIADLILWFIAVVMIVLGVWMSKKLKIHPRPHSILIFALAVMIYMGLRALLDRSIYSAIWSDISEGNLLKTAKLLWDISPWSAIDTLVFGAAVPVALFAVLFWFLWHFPLNRK